MDEVSSLIAQSYGRNTVLTCSFSLGEHLQTSVIKQFSFVFPISFVIAKSLHLGSKLTNYETQKNAGSVAEGNVLPQILMEPF